MSTIFRSQNSRKYKIIIPKSFNGYTIIKELGAGSFSVTVLIEKDDTKELFAAKIILRDQMIERRMYDHMNREIEFTRKLEHPNIIKFYDSFIIKNDKQQDFLIIIEEYCSKGELYYYINNQENVDEKEVKRISKSIAEAIKYLHEMKIAHCDIKPENILLDENMNPKLIDFGLSVDLDEEYVKPCGTAYYAAPELFNKQRKFVNRLKLDIYSFGIVLYVMHERKFPWKNFDEKRFSKFKVETSDPKLNSLVKKCTDLNGGGRPTAKMLVEDDYFKCE